MGRSARCVASVLWPRAPRQPTGRFRLCPAPLYLPFFFAGFFAAFFGAFFFGGILGMVMLRIPSLLRLGRQRSRAVYEGMPILSSGKMKGGRNDLQSYGLDPLVEPPSDLSVIMQVDQDWFPSQFQGRDAAVP